MVTVEVCKEWELRAGGVRKPSENLEASQAPETLQVLNDSSIFRLLLLKPRKGTHYVSGN